MYLKLLNINELERGRYILFTEASFMAQVNIEITSVGINEISRSGKVLKNNISTKRFKDYTHFCRWKKGLNLFNESNTYEKKN
jgi:hypothetical protein